MCDIEPTSAASVDIERDDNLTWTNGQIVAKRRDEGDSQSAQKPNPDGVTNVKMEAMYVLVKATEELLSDSPRLINRITVKAAAAFVHKRNTELFDGTGVGQALGILSASNGALVSVAKDASQTAATVTIGNVNGIWDRVLPRSKQRGVWMCGAGVVSALTKIGQNNENIFMPQGGLSGARFPALLGRPIMETEYLPEIGSQNDLIFVDWMGYKLIERQGINLQRSIHFLFDTSTECFKWTTRWNGLPRLKAPVARNKASNFSMSHFVRLEARA
jgi:HK97 family phage major capsid protein